MLDDQLVGTGEEAVDDAAHLLRAERARQLGEAAEIGEQHGHLPVLGLAWGRRCVVAQVGNGIEQTLAVAERGDSELPQVIPGEATQQLGVDMVGVERVGILGEPQAFKPATDVHVVASTSALAGRYALRGADASSASVVYSGRRPVSLQEHLPDVDRRAMADRVKMMADPAIGHLAANRLQVQEEVHAGVELMRVRRSS